MRILLFLLFGLVSGCHTNVGTPPIIDMHRHAPLASSLATDSGPNEMLLELNDHNVVLSILSVTSPAQAQSWSTGTSDKFILGTMMPCPRNLARPLYDCFPENAGLPDLDWLRENVQSGLIGAFHEMMFNYDGTLPDSQKMAPYWALAEELSVPVGVHSWSGPPPGRSIRANPNCCPDYDGNMGNPKHLRPVLNRHPDLKVWLQHVGSDGDEKPELWDETLDLLTAYPNVYVDLSITNSILPIEVYESALNRLIDAGFGDRIMFATDNLPVELILERLNGLESITDKQRTAILYENAVNFLGLKPKIRR